MTNPAGSDHQTSAQAQAREAMTKDQTADRQTASIRARLEELRNREPPPGAPPPDAAAFTVAASFVERLPKPLREMPHISLADDGELNLAWNGGTIYVDLGFYGTGTYSYFARDPEGAGNTTGTTSSPAARCRLA